MKKCEGPQCSRNIGLFQSFFSSRFCSDSCRTSYKRNLVIQLFTIEWDLSDAKFDNLTKEELEELKVRFNKISKELQRLGDL